MKLATWLRRVADRLDPPPPITFWIGPLEGILHCVDIEERKIIGTARWCTTHHGFYRDGCPATECRFPRCTGVDEPQSPRTGKRKPAHSKIREGS